MAGVLKAEGIDYNARVGDVRRLFKDHMARPHEIHLVLDRNGKHNGNAFLIFKDKFSAKKGLIVDGVLFLNSRVNVKLSSPGEFNKFFPGVPMFVGEVGPPVGRGRGVKRPFNGTHTQVRPGPARLSTEENRSRMFESAAMGRGFSRNKQSKTFNDNERGREYFDDNRDERRDRSRSPFNRNNSSQRGDGFNIQNFKKPRRSLPEGALPHRPSERKSLVTPNNTRRDPGRRDPGTRGGKNYGREERKREEALSVPFTNPVDNVKKDRYLRVSNLPFTVTDMEIQSFFQPLLSRDIFYMRNEGGKHAGKPNGCVIVEFYSDSDTRQALKLDGKRLGQKPAYINKPSKGEIIQAIQGKTGDTPPEGVLNQLSQDMSGLASLANSNPQVQNLLNLLQATVSTLAGAALTGGQPSASTNEASRSSGRSYTKDNRSESRRRERQPDDPVVTRVATSANIDVGDISMGRVVGIRNLPYSVTPGEILQFFDGFHAVPDSVRIHYLEDGRCSGDAIISFKGNKDATAAVSSLNKRTIARRKVELFFL